MAAAAAGERFYEPEIHRLLGEANLRQGRPTGALHHFEQSLASAREPGLVPLAARTAETLAAVETDRQ